MALVHLAAAAADVSFVEASTPALIDVDGCGKPWCTPAGGLGLGRRHAWRLSPATFGRALLKGAANGLPQMRPPNSPTPAAQSRIRSRHNGSA
jgi:hypothetical protein